MSIPGRDRFLQLKSGGPSVLPSLLLCDFGNLAEEVRRVEAAGVRGLHLDVMDGHFVPNLTYGPIIVESIRRLTDLPLDVHLMISDPGKYLEDFIRAGADAVTIHHEACPEPAALLGAAREAGVAAGLVINPDTPVTAIKAHLGLCDLVLVMSVQPGFGGQAFDPRALEKLTYLHEKGPDGLMLEVDGGVNKETIAPCARAGAGLLVAGSAIFRQDDYTLAVDELNRLAVS